MTDLSRRYQELEGTVTSENGRCLFKSKVIQNLSAKSAIKGPYSHLNSLLDFDANINPVQIISPSSCKNENIVFGIKSRPDAKSARKAIRESWLGLELWKSFGYKIKIVFIIAKDGKKGQLKEELEMFDDILLLDFTESFHHLVYKDIGYLHFLEEKCPNAELIFKGDDDILLVPQGLIHDLEQLKSEDNELEAIGCRKPKADVIRNPRSRYFLPEELFENKFFAPYYAGACYVTTGSFAMKMAKALSMTKVLPMDDVFAGELIKNANLMYAPDFLVQKYLF